MISEKETSHPQTDMKHSMAKFVAVRTYKVYQEMIDNIAWQHKRKQARTFCAGTSTYLQEVLPPQALNDCVDEQLSLPDSVKQALTAQIVGCHNLCSPFGKERVSRCQVALCTG